MGTGSTEGVIPNNGAFGYIQQTPELFDPSTLTPLANGIYIPVVTITAKGQILVGTAASALAALSVGSNGQVLSADSTQATGLAWTSVAGLTPPMVIGARAIATASVNLANPGTATFDGVVLATGDRLLVTGNGISNGVYTFATSSTPLVRATDNDSSAEMMTGLSVWVSEGTLYKDTMWRLTTDAPIVLGTTSLTFNSNQRQPGTGASSYVAGQTAVASNSSTTAVGVSATASGSLDTTFGASATASGGSSLAVGQASQATGSNSTALGRNAQAVGVNAIAIGSGAIASNHDSISIGKGASTAAPYAVLVGDLATSGTSVTSGANGEQISVGYSASATEWRCTAVGYFATATAVSATALGRGARSDGIHSFSLGRGSWAGADGMGCLGNFGTFDFYLGGGWMSTYDDWISGTHTVNDPTTQPVYLHANDGFDTTGSPVNNIGGGNILICGGRGTGTAAGGTVSIQVAPAGGVSNNTKNALSTVFQAGLSSNAIALGFYGVTLTPRQLLATGAGHTVDDVITALQTLGLVKQS